MRSILFCRRFPLFIFIAMAATSLFAQQQNSSRSVTAPHSFVAGNKQFLLDGQPFVVRAAELHYPRIPRAYWEHRIRLCKAMGMNTICIYLFWNLHEQQEGQYDFTGDKDFTAFIRLVQQNGMYCIVRPGPYVCAEWDMGGLPWWLLKKKDLQVRSLKDSLFMRSVKRYMNQVGKLLAPLQIQNGGNVIMVQVENEYGVWGKDQAYMTAIRDNIRSAGLDKVQLFRCDWSSNFDRYQVEGVASTLNFGAGSNIDNQFMKFKELNPDAPLMCSEYWTGWFDQWGRQHETRGINTFIGSLKDMLDRNISVSLYMAHGGTSFGQWSGANAPPYAPTVSSYDYDAPIDEAGHTTPKFFAIRELLKNYLHANETLGEIPKDPVPLITIPAIRFTQTAALFNNLPKPVISEDIQPMEMFNQGWGRILYRTTIPAAAYKRKLVLTEVHDWAVVFVNGKEAGKLDRRMAGNNTITLPPLATAARLDILVETTGRVNYGQAITDRKGITSSVVLTGGTDTTIVKHWQVYNFPVDYAFQQKRTYQHTTAQGPAWYKASFNLAVTGDTYLDLSQWGKGMVWVNGHNLGRFWKIGPTQSMFLPGSWLKKGSNEIIVLDVDKPAVATISGGTKPVYHLNPDESLLHRKKGQQLQLAAEKPVAEGVLEPGNGWKTVLLPQVQSGRYFCFEALSAQDEKDQLASIAEMEITGEEGTTISSLQWKVVYADSEEVMAANSTADKLYDLQESVIWQTEKGGPGYPHQIVIDLGSNIKVKGFRLLPRTDKSKAGMIKRYRFYLKEAPFAL